MFLCVCELKKKGLQLKEIREIIPILRTQAYAPEEQQRRAQEMLGEITTELLKHFETIKIDLKAREKSK